MPGSRVRGRGRHERVPNRQAYTKAKRGVIDIRRLPLSSRPPIMNEQRGTRSTTRFSGCAIVCAMARNACKGGFTAISSYKSPLQNKYVDPRKLAPVQGFLRAERRRSRTYPAWGYQTSPVLKTLIRRRWKSGVCSQSALTWGWRAIECATVWA